MKSLRSFQRQEQRKMRNAGIIVCMFFALSLLFLTKSYYCPRSKLITSVRDERMAIVTALNKPLNQKGDGDDDDDDDDDEPKKTVEPVCDFSGSRSDTCDVQGDIRIEIGSATIFFATTDSPVHRKHQQWRIRPYARKNSAAHDHVKEWLLQPSSSVIAMPSCTANHSDPAVVFSGGGFTGNIFHDFTDVLVPVFISSHQFRRRVQLIVADGKPWWVSRYLNIFKKLSKHRLITVEASAKEEVHCFPRAIVGPAFHRELGVDMDLTPGGYSIMEFKKVLVKALGLKRENVATVTATFRPRLLIVTRNRSRVLVNQRAVEEMAKSLGYEVIVQDPEQVDFSKFARMVNSADVLLGVHGSGLTNMIFLPTGAVMVVIVPFGSLHWLARGNYGDPAAAMGIKYLEYQVQVDESSLADEYPAGSEELRNPLKVHARGWNAMAEVYLEKQNVRPHLGRLKDTLLEALRLLPKNRALKGRILMHDSRYY